MSQITNVNQVTIMGNIGREPDYRQTDGGHSFVNFTLAHSEKKYQGDGYDTHWYNVNTRGQAKEDFIARINSGQQLKGSPVEISGKLSTRSFTDRSGVKRTTIEIIAFRVIFYEKRVKAQAESRGVATTREMFEGQTSGIMPGYTPPMTPDEIPF